MSTWSRVQLRSTIYSPTKESCFGKKEHGDSTREDTGEGGSKSEQSESVVL